MAVSPTNRRRSQRLFLQVPVTVSYKAPGQPEFAENTNTIVVNAHGALVEMSISPPQGQQVVIRNARTSDKEDAIVKLVTTGETGKFNVAIEFIRPSPKFWHISFPPEDWSVRHPEAKARS